jgi:hypothetical protein
VFTGPRSRFAAALLLVAVHASPALADELLLQRLVSAYNAGDLSALPLAQAATLNGEEARGRFATQFTKTPHRLLLLQLVRCSATRCTANYYQTAGADLVAGSLTAYVNEQGLIERLVQDDKLWPAGSSQLSVDAGQLADKVSTAAALPGSTGSRCGGRNRDLARELSRPVHGQRISGGGDSLAWRAATSPSAAPSASAPARGACAS